MENTEKKVTIFTKVKNFLVPTTADGKIDTTRIIERAACVGFGGLTVLGAGMGVVAHQEHKKKNSAAKTNEQA